MKKRVVWALGLIGLCSLTFIFTKGHVDIAVYKAVISNVPASMALLAYTVIGVVIGVLLK